MKNRKTLTSQSTLRKEAFFRINKVLVLQRKGCIRNNLRFFKLYYFFQFDAFLQYFFKKNILLKPYCISSIRYDNTYLKINKIFHKKLFVFNFVSFQSEISFFDEVQFN